MKVSRTFDHTAIFCKHQLTNINLVTSAELPIFAGEVIRFLEAFQRYVTLFLDMGIYSKINFFTLSK